MENNHNISYVLKQAEKMDQAKKRNGLGRRRLRRVLTAAGIITVLGLATAAGYIISENNKRFATGDTVGVRFNYTQGQVDYEHQSNIEDPDFYSSSLDDSLETEEQDF